MTAANDWVSPSESSPCDQLAKLAAECAPRRFVLCWFDLDDEDSGILAWGLVLISGKVIVTGDDGGVFGTFASAECARDLLGRRRDLFLVWLDQSAAGPGEDGSK